MKDYINLIHSYGQRGAYLDLDRDLITINTKGGAVCLMPSNFQGSLILTNFLGTEIIYGSIQLGGLSYELA